MSKGGKLFFPVLFRGEGKWNSLIADAAGKWAALSYPQVKSQIQARLKDTEQITASICIVLYLLIEKSGGGCYLMPRERSKWARGQQ
jgi:hypothetical protein